MNTGSVDRKGADNTDGLEAKDATAPAEKVLGTGRLSRPHHLDRFHSPSRSTPNSHTIGHRNMKIW